MKKIRLGSTTKNQKSRLLEAAAFLGVTAMTMAGCSKGAVDAAISAAAPTSAAPVTLPSTVVTNDGGLKIQVTNLSAAIHGARQVTRKQKSKKIASKSALVRQRDAGPVAACTINVYDITGTEILATGTTNGSGIASIQNTDDANADLNGLNAGTPYKVIADCGANGSYVNIVTASSDLPTAPVITDPDSTVAAVETVKAISDAVANATAGLSTDAATAVYASIATPANASAQL